MKKKLK